MLPMQYPRQRERRTGFHGGSERWSQSAEGTGEDVRHEDIGEFDRSLAGQIDVQIIVNAVALRVVMRSDECLRIVVDADRACRAELQCRDGEDARAAAVVEDEFAGHLLAVQPLEAHRGGRMRARAEGEARIEADHDDTALGRRLDVPRIYHQGPPERIRLELVLPCPPPS